MNRLVGRFPGPLAVIAASGAVDFVNEPFARQFDQQCLVDRSIQAIVDRADGTHHAVQLSDRGGVRRVLEVQAIAFERSTVLLFDVPGVGGGASQLAHLRVRIGELELSSATDRLTGTWNRAHLDAVLVNELARSERYRVPLSLILIDIDHFKRVNDTYGHQTGDEVLRELTARIQQVKRTADMLFRWGGEEFVVLATSSGYRAASTLAEKLRARIEAHGFPVVGKVTISVGVAEHTGSEDPEVWFRRVDEALYAAKHGGRNRVRVDPQGNSDTWAAAVGGALQLTWTEAYGSGESTIDREHEELFVLANAVIDASARANHGGSGLTAALDTLAGHVVEHFAHEEAILAEHAYEHLDRHRVLHAALIARLGELRMAADQGQCSFGDVVDFIANTVVMRHMLAADRQFFPLFKGLSAKG